MASVSSDSTTLVIPENNQPFRWRSVMVTSVFLLFWIILIGRLIYLQGTQHEFMHTRVDRQSTFTEKLTARPGEIVDRNGHVLAKSIYSDKIASI